MSALASLSRLHAWMASHLGRVLFACAVLLGLGAALYGHATTDTDIGAMLPGGPGSPREAAKLLGELGALNTLLLDLEVPGATRDALVERGAELTSKLRASGDFADIYTGPSTQDLMRLGTVMLPRRLYLFENPAAELRKRLEPGPLGESLVGLKEKLTSPQAFAMKRELLQDPLGLNAQLLAGFMHLAGDVAPYRGQLLSKDGRHLLLVTTPTRPALDSRASEQLLGKLRRLGASLPPGPGGPAVLRAVGGPRFSMEGAAAVKRDVAVTLLTSLVSLMLLFYARFRSLRLLVLASLPLGFGVVGGLAAVVAVQGHIHALTFAFGSVLMGVGIDYPIYLLNASSAQPEEGLARLRVGLGKTWRSLWFGFITTFLGFLVMLLSKFPGLRELALFAGAGIGVSFAATVVLLPPLSARWGPRRWPGVPRWMQRAKGGRLSPRFAWGLTAVLLGGSLALAPRLQFDGDLRHLDVQRPEVMAEYQEVVGRFGVGGSDSLVVSRGATAEEALQVNDQVQRYLSEAQRGGWAADVRSLAAFLPSRQSQTRRASELRVLDLGDARSRLAAAAKASGFSVSAFSEFWREVESAREGKLAALTPEDFAETSLAPLVGRLLRCSPSGCIAVTSLTLSRPGAAQRLKALLPPGASLLDATALAEDTVAQLPRQMALLSGVGLLVNVLLLAFAYRSARLAFLACVPCLLGLLGTVAVLALTHTQLNLVSSSALVLILGCGVDYGIFVLQESTRPAGVAGIESMGVLLAAISTLAGFGTLVLASSRALQSLGAVVGLGVAFSALASLVLLPGLAVQRRPGGSP